MAGTQSVVRRGGHPAAGPLAVEFSLVLTRTIEAIKDDPSQLRNAIYELARIKLQKEKHTSKIPG